MRYPKTTSAQTAPTMAPMMRPLRCVAVLLFNRVFVGGRCCLFSSGIEDHRRPLSRHGRRGLLQGRALFGNTLRTRKK